MNVLQTYHVTQMSHIPCINREKITYKTFYHSTTDIISIHSLPTLDSMSCTLVKKLTPRLVRIWEDLGIRLGMSFSQLTVIEKSLVPRSHLNPALILLQTWRDSRERVEGEREELLRALKHLKKNDLVHSIETGAI